MNYDHTPAFFIGRVLGRGEGSRGGSRRAPEGQGGGSRSSQCPAVGSRADTETKTVQNIEIQNAGESKSSKSAFPNSDSQLEKSELSGPGNFYRKEIC